MSKLSFPIADVDYWLRLSMQGRPCSDGKAAHALYNVYVHNLPLLADANLAVLQRPRQARALLEARALFLGSPHSSTLL